MSECIEFKKAYFDDAWARLGGRVPARPRFGRPIVSLKEEVTSAVAVVHKMTRAGRGVYNIRFVTHSDSLGVGLGSHTPAYNERRIAVVVAMAKIGEFQELPNGWAGEETAAITSTVCAAAKLFLRALPLRLPLPVFKPTADGEVIFIWSSRRAKLQVVLDTDNILAWVIRGQNGAQSDAEAWKGAIPGRLTDTITYVVG